MLIATPISHLFKLEPEIQKVIDVSDCFECRDISLESNISKQRIYHSDFELMHKWTDREKETLSSVQSTKEELELISFHIATCFSNPVVINGIFQPGGIEYSREDMFANSNENVRNVKDIFGDKIDIAVENNNYFPTKAYRDVTDNDFVSCIVNENNIGFVFDIAHAKVTTHNRNMNHDGYIRGLPLNRCVQLHISQYDVSPEGVAYDAHTKPNEELYEYVKNILHCHGKIKYLTVEYYKDVETLFLVINKIKEIMTAL
jgi:uncharacterized protein (UPF0276 family)|tara:strand:+ start:610 stop:1386 length:777 start_codon:yes stop_codon:yes gene_type:complete